MKQLVLLFIFGGALCSCRSPSGMAPTRHAKKTAKPAPVSSNPEGGFAGSGGGGTQLPGLPPAGSGAAGASPGGGAAAGSVFDFSSAFSGGGGMTSRIVNWRRSGTDAIGEARRAGVPLLVFFSNHATPTSAMLEGMLNSAPEATAVGQHFIPLYVDFGDKDTRDSLYYRALLERYKPRGYPVLLVTLPDGTEVTRQSGYAGESKAEPEWRQRTLQFITAAVAKSDKAAALRRQRLEQEGYRTWTNNQGKPVFAKLEHLDANQATFTGEWGESFRTFTSRLSDADRRAIEQHNPPRG
jgi:hypothetical protein